MGNSDLTGFTAGVDAVGVTGADAPEALGGVVALMNNVVEWRVLFGSQIFNRRRFPQHTFTQIAQNICVSVKDQHAVMPTRFPVKRATRAKGKTTSSSAPVVPTLNWFQQIPLLVKLLFLGLLITIGVLVSWKVRAAIRQQNVELTPLHYTQLHTTQPQSQIHILIHLYRGNPDIVARSLFGAFEAAKYPQFVHIHLFQELCAGDGVARDVFQTYTTTYARQHSWDSTRVSMDANFHVVNENPSQSAGHFVSLLTLAQESVAPILKTHDIVIAPQAFYDSPGTIHLFPLTFAQDYDELLRTSSLEPHTMYSGRIPRTSLSATSANQVTALTSSLTQAIGQNLIIPYFKTKEHSHYLESRASNTCSAAAAANLAADQTGFTAYTTSDRVRAPRARQTTTTDIPFTVFRLNRDSYRSNARHPVEWNTYVATHTATLVQPVPIVGVHEDVVVCRASTWIQLMHYTHGAGRAYLVPGPYYTQTITMSNLMYAANLQLRSMNHLPIVAIFDHLTGAAATVDPSTLSKTKAFAPHNWMVALKPVRADSDELVPIEMDDPCDVIQLDVSYGQYAGVFVDNVTRNGFMGITSIDTRSTIHHKFGSAEEFERQTRLLNSVQFSVQTTA